MATVFLFLMCVSVPAAALAGFTAWTAYRVSRAVPPAGQFIEVEGLRLHYVELGSGPAILMIHGLASQLQTFTHSLAARLPDFRLILVDRPGAGYSQAGPSASLSAQAALVAGLMKTRGIDRALIVGHSLGGAVALALATDHPNRVAGLALVAPASQSQARPPNALRGLALRNDVARWLVGWTLATPIGLIRGDRTNSDVFAPDPVPADFGIAGGGCLTLRPWTFRNAARDLMQAGADLVGAAARYKDIHAPVGVLFGDADRLLDPRDHGEVLCAQIAGATFECVAQGGHMLPLSDPDRCAAFIREMAARAGLIDETLQDSSLRAAGDATQGSRGHLQD